MRCAHLSDCFLFVSRRGARRALFGLQEFGNIYTRIMNPTNDVFEKRVALSKAALPGWHRLRHGGGNPGPHYSGFRAGDELSPPSRSMAHPTRCSATPLRAGITVRFVTAVDFDGLRAPS